MTATRSHSLLLVSPRCFNEVDRALGRANPSGKHDRKLGLPIRLLMDGLALVIDDSADAMRQRVAHGLGLRPDVPPVHPDVARHTRALLRLLSDAVSTGRLAPELAIQITGVLHEASEWCPGVRLTRVQDAVLLEIADP